MSGHYIAGPSAPVDFDENDALHQATEALALLYRAEALRRCSIGYLNDATEEDLASAAISAALQGLLQTEEARKIPGTAAIAFTLGATLGTRMQGDDYHHIEDILGAVGMGFGAALKAMEAGKTAQREGNA